MKIRVGYLQQEYGTITVLDDGITLDGDTAILQRIVEEAQHAHIPLERLPDTMRYYTWAVIEETKFNPFHDRRGRFASGGGLGIAPPGQGELPGMPQGLNPDAVRQPVLFGPTGESTYTELVHVDAKQAYPEDVPVDKLADAELTPLGGDLDSGDNPRYSAEVDGTKYFVKSLESRILAMDSSEQVQSEIGARAAAKVVGLENQTVPVDTFESGWTGTECLAQPFIKRKSGLQLDISLYRDEDDWEAGSDIEVGVKAMANIDTDVLSKMIGYEYAMGTEDRHEGQYLFDENAPKNQTILMNDFGADLQWGTNEDPSYLAKLADYTGRNLRVKDIATIPAKTSEIQDAMLEKGVSPEKVSYVLDRLVNLRNVVENTDEKMLSVADFEAMVNGYG